MKKNRYAGIVAATALTLGLFWEQIAQKYGIKVFIRGQGRPRKVTN